ncbi:MAG: His/Gly/Thr/Pro-type tRNA ligase C-terminal domain-containing protein, partial [Patescibacteria group bacterium]
ARKLKVFERVGLGELTFLTFASGGAFSKYSHEFQTLSDAGEDTIYLSPEKKIAVNEEVYSDDVLEELKLEKKTLERRAAIEVGNIFKLGTRFSEPLGLFFKDADGNRKPVVMGSYGIGPSRVMGTIAEALSDDKGLVWPSSVAPSQVHLISLGDMPDVREHSQKLYDMLYTAGIEALFDDRNDAGAGEKFADADLIGIPYRVIVSGKTLADGAQKAEIRGRKEKDGRLVDFNGVVREVSQKS